MLARRASIRLYTLLGNEWQIFRLRYYLNRRSVSVLLHFVISTMPYRSRHGGDQRRLFSFPTLSRSGYSILLPRELELLRDAIAFGIGDAGQPLRRPRSGSNNGNRSKRRRRRCASRGSIEEADSPATPVSQTLLFEGRRFDDRRDPEDGLLAGSDVNRNPSL